MCNSSDPSRSHPAEYAVDASSDTWWQTISWLDFPQPLHTTYTVSFNKLYRLTDDLIITFNSGLLICYSDVIFFLQWVYILLHFDNNFKIMLRGDPVGAKCGSRPTNSWGRYGRSLNFLISPKSSWKLPEAKPCVQNALEFSNICIWNIIRLSMCWHISAHIILLAFISAMMVRFWIFIAIGYLSQKVW